MTLIEPKDDALLMECMILVYSTWVSVLFNTSATHSFSFASYANALGLKMEMIENLLLIKSLVDTNSIKMTFLLIKLITSIDNFFYHVN